MTNDEDIRFLRCFDCRRVVPPFDAAYGPICGPTERHPRCGDSIWHRHCRDQWLADLAVWEGVLDKLPVLAESDAEWTTEEEPLVSTIRAPFTERQVAELNRYQVADIMHPFTCPNDGHADEVVLLATTEGWFCPVRRCTYRQDWAHSFMADS